jgi:hypothetical protein
MQKGRPGGAALAVRKRCLPAVNRTAQVVKAIKRGRDSDDGAAIAAGYRRGQHGAQESNEKRPDLSSRANIGVLRSVCEVRRSRWKPSERSPNSLKQSHPATVSALEWATVLVLGSARACR